MYSESSTTRTGTFILLDIDSASLLLDCESVSENFCSGVPLNWNLISSLSRMAFIVADVLPSSVPSYILTSMPDFFKASTTFFDVPSGTIAIANSPKLTGLLNFVSKYFTGRFCKFSIKSVNPFAKSPFLSISYPYSLLSHSIGSFFVIAS